MRLGKVTRSAISSVTMSPRCPDSGNRRCEEWGWDVMIDVLTGAPGIEDNIGSEQIDRTVEAVSETEGQ